MANSSFSKIVQVGGLNGGNSAMMDVIDSDRLPWAFSPELVFEHTVKWTDLLATTAVAQTASQVVGGTIVAGNYVDTFVDARTGVTLATCTYVVHEDTVTIAGTASDGFYDTIFTIPTPPVRVRTTRTAGAPATNNNLATQHAADITDLIATSLAGIVTSASAATNVVTIVYAAGIAAQFLTCTETTATGTITDSVAATTSTVAAGLEALVQTARATSLLNYVADETVAVATISLTYVAGVQVTLTPTFAGAATGVVTITNVATIPMGRTGDWFPSAVAVGGAILNVPVAFTGGTPTITATVGDAGDVDGLLTSTSIAATGASETIAAAENTEHYEGTFQPLVTITSNRVFTSLTAGEISAMIWYSPPPTI